ncbi:hypothetical protein, partial [Sphingobacterium daejeonense]|uniref:hypothetical protein n=1 Tax=Sphingobacterium daejeonense TaxID=371142 RepID=UPI003D319C3F
IQPGAVGTYMQEMPLHYPHDFLLSFAMPPFAAPVSTRGGEGERNRRDNIT